MAKETSDKKQGPRMVAVFQCPVMATLGQGSTTVLVIGQSGKCRLYGRTSVKNLLSELGEPNPSRVVGLPAEKLSEALNLPIIVGSDACRKYMSDKKLEFAGNERILDKSDKKGGGFRKVVFSDF